MDHLHQARTREPLSFSFQNARTCRIRVSDRVHMGLRRAALEARSMGIAYMNARASRVEGGVLLKM